MEVNHQEQEQRNCFAQERKWLFSASLHIPPGGGGGGFILFPVIFLQLEN